MPELPEVETVVRGLRPRLSGRTIVGVRLGKTDFMDDPVALARWLPGRRIAGVGRFGKFIHIEMEPPGIPVDAVARLHLILHLGMSGRMAVQPSSEPAPPHTHAFFELDDGGELRYTAARRFGRIVLLSDSDLATFRRRLGAEPLEISVEAFLARLAGRRSRIKALLLDQHVLCGLGNIYVDESLWLARIHPMRPAARLTSEDLVRLRAAIRTVLRSAIRLRGSSISDFLDAEGHPGRYQQQHRVYQRQGEPCHRCGRAIRCAVVAGRSSHFCVHCQAPPRKGRARKTRFGLQSKSLGKRALRRPPIGAGRAGRPAARREAPGWDPPGRTSVPALGGGHGDFSGLR